MIRSMDENPAIPSDAPSPEQVAHEYMSLLRDLKDETRPELVRTRRLLLQAIDDFSASSNKDLAQAELWGKLRGVETVVCRLVLGRVKKLAKQFRASAKQVDKTTRDGKAVHAFARALRDLYLALNALKNAANARDEIARARAQQMLVDAQEYMSRTQARYGEI